MDLKVSAQRLCLLLSWQEALSRTPHREAYAGSLYRRHAARSIERLRAEARDAIGEAGEQLQSRMGVGDDGPEAAQLRHRIQQLNHLLKAQNASDLGGPVAMTLDAYAAAFQANKPQGPYSFTPLGRQDAITIMVSLVVMIAVCLGLLWFQLWRANTSFSLTDAGPNHLALKMENEGQIPVAFLGSWPLSEASSELATYGVVVYCRAKDEDSFQLAAAIDDIWIFQNEYMAPQRLITVEPGVTITVLLDLLTLESTYGAPLDAVRLECGPASRRRQAVFEADVSTNP